MNKDHVQNLRYKLQKRVRRLKSVEYEIYHSRLQQLLGFLHGNPIFIGILDGLANKHSSLETNADAIIEKGEQIVCDNEEDNAALAYFILRKCAKSTKSLVEVNVGFIYFQKKAHNDNLDHFNTLFVEPLYEYIDEHIDDQGAILSLLERYKHKCEWFQRASLYEMWSADTQRGEKNLVFHLYEYLHDQGLNFSIEPLSASGEVDIIAAQQTEEPLIADAKIYNPDKKKGKDYIARGFNQIYLYTQDYNEPFGFLIIYNTSGNDLDITLTGQAQSTPYLVHNNKTIYIVTIDIYPHESSASKRGTIKTTKITESDLVKSIKTEKR